MKAAGARGRSRVFIGLGGNVGNRLSFLRRGAAALKGLPGTRVRGVSAVYETSAVGPGGRDYLNAAAEIETSLKPSVLLRALKSAEGRLGRRRRKKWGPREIDLDILFYGEKRLRTGGLTVPHPRLAERFFVLRPLADLAPRFRDPASGKTVAALLRRLTAPDQRIKVFRRRL